MPADVDPPDRVKWSDDVLDWLIEYRLDWEDRLFKLERSTLLIAAFAETMVNTDTAHRRAMINSIHLELRDAGIWPPPAAPDEPDTRTWAAKT